MPDRRKNAVLLLMLMMTAGISFPASAKATQTDAVTPTETEASNEPVVQETFEDDVDETEDPFYEAEPISDSASFSNSGNMKTQDRLDESSREFLTVTTRNGNIFYLVIDRNVDGDNVHFLNQVDEADLLPLLDEESKKTYEELKTEESSAEASDIPVAEAPPTTEPQKESILSKLKLGTVIPLLILIGALAMFLKDRFKKKNDDHHGEDPDGPDEEYEFEDDHEDEFTDDDDYELPQYEDDCIDQRHQGDEGPRFWKASANAQKQVDDFENGKKKHQENATVTDPDTLDEDVEELEDVGNPPDIIRLENVDAEEFFAGQNPDADTDDVEDVDLDFDEEGVVNAEKALFDKSHFKKNGSRAKGNQSAQNENKNLEMKKENRSKTSDSSSASSMNTETKALGETESDKSEDDYGQSADRNQPDDMFKHFGRPKKVYMFCYDDEAI